jgi:hypothetical protein
VNDAARTDEQARSSAAALRALGLRCTVEAMGNLAVVIPALGERALEDAGVRRAVLIALRAYGFTHAAVEPRDGREAATTAGAPRQ